jgi:DnaJ-class molecular chaperone
MNIGNLDAYKSACHKCDGTGKVSCRACSCPTLNCRFCDGSGSRLSGEGARRYREDKGFTTAEVARHSGYTRQYIYLLEMEAELSAKVAKAIIGSIDELVEERALAENAA